MADQQNQTRLSDLEAELEKTIASVSKAARKKNTRLLFIPLFLGLIALLIPILSGVVSQITNTPDAKIALLSKEVISTPISSPSSPTKVCLTLEFENGSSEDIDNLSYYLTIKDKSGTVLLASHLEWNAKRPMDRIVAGGSTTHTYTIEADGHIESMWTSSDQVNFDKLLAADVSDLQATYQIRTISHYMGDTVNYEIPFVLQNTTLYVGIVGVALVAELLWVWLGFSSRCPKCKMFFAMKPDGSTELGRRSGRGTVTRHLRDKYGKSIGSYDEQVEGDYIDYISYDKCKHCHHTVAFKGQRFREKTK